MDNNAEQNKNDVVTNQPMTSNNTPPPYSCAPSAPSIYSDNPNHSVIVAPRGTADGFARTPYNQTTEPIEEKSCCELFLANIIRTQLNFLCQLCCCIDKTYPCYNKDTGEINMSAPLESSNPKHMNVCEMALDVLSCQIDGSKIACMPFIFCCCLPCDAARACEGREGGSC